MLFLVLVLLAVSSTALFFLKRDGQTFLLLGLCFSFICMFIGIIIYLAKTGGLTQDQKVFLFFGTAIQRRLSYLVFPLRQLGFMIAIGRYLFPAFLLLYGIRSSMIPLLQRQKKHLWIPVILPAASLVIYYPDIFFKMVKGRFALQGFLIRFSVIWIWLYVLFAACLLIHEYCSVTIPYLRRQYRYILIFIGSVTLQYLVYCNRDPIQVYQMYSAEYMRFKEQMYSATYMGTVNWYLFTVFTLVFVVIGFWNLRTYTIITHQENEGDVLMQRKFDAASMGASVFVHSIKNQLLSNRVLYKKMNRELEGDSPDSGKLKEYSAMLDDINESMLKHLNELYKSIKTNSISLSAVYADQVAAVTMERFHKKYPDIFVACAADVRDSVLADIEHLSEALYNLLANAYEAAAAAGREEVSLSFIAHSERLYIAFEIRDNGTGIPAQDQRKIFDPFYTSKNTNYNWGMGLYYVKQIVKSHLGMLRIESRMGEGTSFFILIPRYEPRAGRKKEKFWHDTSDCGRRF